MEFEKACFPPGKWFAGRIFLYTAKNLVLSYKNFIERDNKLFEKYYVAVLDIIRSIRAIYLLPVDKQSAEYGFDSLMVELKEVMKFEHYLKLKNLINSKMKVEYRNGILFDNEDPSIKNVIYMFGKGINERIILLGELIDLTIEIFYEILYEYHNIWFTEPNFYEYYSEEDIYWELNSLDVIDESEIDINEFCDSNVNIYDYPELVEKGDREIYNIYKSEHRNHFWKWEESDAYC